MKNDQIEQKNQIYTEYNYPINLTYNDFEISVKIYYGEQKKYDNISRFVNHEEKT